MYEFVFIYDDRVRLCHTKEEALRLFNDGGFSSATCYFPKEHAACFRSISSREDIITLK